MNYIVRSSVYRKPDGTVTHSRKEGDTENELVLVSGAVVSQKTAESLKLAELDAAARAPKSSDPLADLKPFEVEAAVDETPAPPEKATTKATKKADETPQEVK